MKEEKKKYGRNDGEEGRKIKMKRKEGKKEERK